MPRIDYIPSSPYPRRNYNNIGQNERFRDYNNIRHNERFSDYKQAQNSHFIISNLSLNNEHLFNFIFHSYEIKFKNFHVKDTKQYLLIFTFYE